MSFPTCLAACFVIQRIFEEKWDRSIVQLHGWGSLGEPSRAIFSLRTMDGVWSTRRGWSCFQTIQFWGPGVPNLGATEISRSVCPKRSSAPFLQTSLVSLLSSCFTTAWPLPPSPIPQSLRSVLLPSSWSSGPCSCHALASSAEATSVFHLDYGSLLLASLSASGFAPPPSRHCNQRGLLYCKVNAIMLFPFKIFQKISVATGLSPISLNSLCKALLILFPSRSPAGSFTTGYSSHPSYLSSFQFFKARESSLASATLPSLLLSEEVASFPSFTSYPQSEGPVASLRPQCTHRPTLRSPVVPPECYMPQQLFRTGSASCSPLFPVPRMVLGNT